MSVNAAALNGVADQSFFIGDGAVRFTLEFKSAVSAFANTLGFYKIKADGTIDNVQILFDNTLDVAAGARSVDLGVPGNGERIGFFLIQNGFDAYGDLQGTLSFVAPGTGQAASVDSGAATLTSTALGGSPAPRSSIPPPPSIRVVPTRSCPASGRAGRNCRSASRTCRAPPATGIFRTL